ncbi:MAG: O-antigen ligase family protein, partial [Chloroflexota bacterium]
MALIAMIPLAALPVTLGPIQIALTELLVLLATVSVAVERWRQPQLPRQPLLQQREHWPVILFLVAALASLLVTEYPRQSLRELRVLIVEPVALYVLLRSVPLDSLWLQRAVRALIGLTTAVTLVGLGMAMTGHGLVDAEGVQRVVGLYPSPNHFALILGRVIPFSLALALAAGPGRALYGLATGTMIVGLLATFSGGGWLGAAASGLVVVWFMLGGRWALGVLALSGIAGALALGVIRVERIASRIDPSRGTGFIRLRLWEASLAMVRDHPVLGIGLDNFLYRYQQQYLPPEA